jgi:hypothetical protein
MAFLSSAPAAREQSQGNALVAQEVCIITLRMLAAISNNALSTVSGSQTQVTINGVTITGSTMTNADSTGRSYYQVWKGVQIDAAKIEQMNEVIDYFRNLGYSIVRKSVTGTEFYWEISW